MLTTPRPARPSNLYPLPRPTGPRRGDRRKTKPSRPRSLERLEDRTLLSGWALDVGGTNDDAGNAVAVDASGNAYVTGSFTGTVDFDPGPSIYNLTSAGNTGDVFIAKYSSSGLFLWARRAGGTTSVDSGRGIAVDPAGNVYVAGNFIGSADFGPFTVNSASPGWNDVFVSKLDPSGSFLWVRTAGGPTSDFGLAIAVDTGGNLYVSGGFEGTADFSGVQLTSAGGRDAFVWKLDGNGNVAWAIRAGSAAGPDQATGVAIDPNGNAAVTGWFTGTGDFGPTTLTSAGERDVFVSKVDPAGNFIWAEAMGGPRTDMAFGVAVDGAGGIYTTGIFAQASPAGTMADFDPGPGVYNLTSAGNEDAFVSKLDGSGAFAWAAGTGGANDDEGLGIAIDSGGNAYATGLLGGGTADFDPGLGTAYLNSTANRDAFLWKLGGAGNFLAARQMGTTNWGEGHGVAVDSGGSIYSTGRLLGTAYFDSGTATVQRTSVSDSGCSCAFDMSLVKTTQEAPASPQLSHLLDSPDPVTRGGTLTLTAAQVRIVAGGSNIASVSFYRDANGNGVLNVGTDTLLGTDTNGSDGWRLATSIPSNFKVGTYTYFAQAKDSANVLGNVVLTTNTVSGGKVAAAFGVRPASAPLSADVAKVGRDAMSTAGRTGETGAPATRAVDYAIARMIARRSRARLRHANLELAPDLLAELARLF